ncbi:MAG: hypothetical protein P8075_17135 [Deltaproteobacteria bacterium]|jgi:hypothetical protein
MRNRIITLAAATYLAMACWAMAGQPVVSHLIVTDVNPLAFSVAWVASEPSTCTVRLFDEQHRNLADVKTISESRQHRPAEDLGVMKVRVHGLRPDTNYLVQTVTTSKKDGKIIIYPEKPISVRTEKNAVPVSNSVFAQKIYHTNQMKGDGSLLIASVDGESYPVSGWVGAQPNPPSPWALVDLNNLYSARTHQNLEVRGGEKITVEVLGGVRGYSRFSGKVPHASQGSIIELSPPIVLKTSQ